ncbi:hypothetical protein [Pseudomaricurvus alkylphenolicus]|nr:hypothetical protein [Pseudomaricurvus alkylphenolicus]
MKERLELIAALEAYREEYSMSYESGCAMDLLIKNLKLEEQSDED